jgi:hypothetical protein
VSADDQQGSDGQGSGTGAPGATPAPSSASEQGKPNVIASSGEAEARAYVAPIEVPSKRPRMKTMEMVKVRITDERGGAELLDPRKAVTAKMNVPPGGPRPPPPPAHAEVADPASSPWSAGGGIDRSMLPSAALGSTGVTQTKKPSIPPADKSDDRGIGIWLGVILVAATLGGGLAFLLRTSAKPEGGPSVSSTAPIAVTVPATGATPVVPPVATPAPTAAATEPGGEAPPELPPDLENIPEINPPALEPGATGVRPPPRKTKATTSSTAPSATPTTSATGPKRLFD